MTPSHDEELRRECEQWLLDNVTIVTNHPSFGVAIDALLRFAKQQQATGVRSIEQWLNGLGSFDWIRKAAVKHQCESTAKELEPPSEAGKGG